MVLGASQYKNGVRATMFTRSDRGIGYLAGEGDDAKIVRSVYQDATEAKKSSPEPASAGRRSATSPATPQGRKSTSRPPAWTRSPTRWRCSSAARTSCGRTSSLAASQTSGRVSMAAGRRRTSRGVAHRVNGLLWARPAKPKAGGQNEPNAA
ncbi:hypothetical protein [Amycolatopsis sulphurea]|uniref:hypothetical protein n=1 Tax=Amycolatopsis sulphurea TaxID=76022 RepID=UPI001145225F|nr:hypothetical protein [Amycolatopsis sulphurea]